MEQISLVRFIIPEWLELFAPEHPIRLSVLENIKSYFNQLNTKDDIENYEAFNKNMYI